MALWPEYIGSVEGTGGIETSKYPEEEKTTCDSLSSGERKGTKPKPNWCDSLTALPVVGSWEL